MDHLEAAEVLARMLYDPEREYSFTKEEIVALKWAIRTMRIKAKENNNVEKL